MSKEEIIQVAETIREQLLHNFNEVAAWGSKDFKAVYLEEKPGLEFSIRTLKIKNGGRVQVLYDTVKDTYVVKSFRVHSMQIKDLQSTDDVYAVDLHNIINDFIEDEESMRTTFF